MAGRPVAYPASRTITVEFVRNARLVCRRFNQLTSRHLLGSAGAVSIDLSQKSTDRFEGLTKNPVSSRTAAKAIVFLLWIPAQGLHEWDFNKKLSRARGNYRAIERTWAKFLPPSFVGIEPRRDDTDGSIGALKYQEILLSGYEDFQQLHKQQYELITSGTFVKSIASSMARIGRRGVLVFIHSDEESLEPQPSGSFWRVKDFSWPNFLEASGFLGSPQTIAGCLTGCLDWKNIERLEGGADLYPARILSELPIAISKVSPLEVSLLDRYTVRCFPVYPNTDKDCLRPQLDCWNWGDLSMACSRLSAFHFSLDHPPFDNFQHLPLKEMAPIEAFFGALLLGSAATLQLLSLNLKSRSLCPYSWCDPQPGPGLFGIMRKGGFLSSVTLSFPRLETLRLTGMEIEQAQFEHFCTAVAGSGCLKEISLEDITLHGPSWVGVTDILRKAVRNNVLRIGATVYLSHLWGGELGYPVDSDESDDGAAEALWENYVEMERARREALQNAVSGSESGEDSEPGSEDSEEIEMWDADYEKYWPVLRQMKEYLRNEWDDDLQNPFGDAELCSLPLIPGRVRSKA
ncbi:hypothetical protein QBC35DRAFT_467950 [Podospora australis]|uniref:Uncharacterized protein n=1 Tax=Podospora australis TaxID=1536484 RepID=A0AAN6WIP1_9PEZI|nr:hypothetical protein QBC35DRAFT_467950 [Podospora australis]